MATTGPVVAFPDHGAPEDRPPEGSVALLREQAFKYAFDLAELAERERRVSRQLREALMATVRALATLTESRRPGSLQHGARVGRRAQALAARMGLDEQTGTHALLAGLLHDAGVPVLLPSDADQHGVGAIRLLRQHPIKSVELIEGVSALEPLVPFILEHHEALDGSGYPHGLRGKAVSLPGRLMAVAEMYEEQLLRLRALSSHDDADALTTVERAAGTVLDGRVVQALRASVLAGDAV
ncbi:MAG TPA: HD domain-containing phosphohydrolase [Chloroflexota bacterium]|jgi:HD-GYP domain-containing protein (c-di-GMP phosphodiesterase class II)|nr:HD domain-containing phosphohydrolase [Chloroflexota bacterium]